jgi:hypothetical protein
MFGDGVVISDGQFYPTKPGHQYTPCILNSQIHRSELHTDLTGMKAGKSAQETIQISTKTFLFNPEIPHSWPLYPFTLVFTILGHHANRDSTLDPT